MPDAIHCAVSQTSETAADSEHHAREKGRRITQNDVLRAVPDKQWRGPIGIRILIQRQFSDLASFDLRVQFL
jgi:hypothetical protein